MADLSACQEIFGDTQDKTIIYVGDHIADVLFARGLCERLGPSNTVISVVVTHSGANPQQWRAQPDKVIENPSALVDWIDQLISELEPAVSLSTVPTAASVRRNQIAQSEVHR